MERGGVSQIPEAKRLVGAFADTDYHDPAKSSVFKFVCVSQAGKHEMADEAQSFRFEVKDLSVSLEGCLF